jgi:predicted GNAT superfamily acetyltransferase
MTLIQAQQKYIDRVNGCHPSHQRRVARAAWAELFKWAESRGMDAKTVCNDAKDVAALEQGSEE